MWLVCELEDETSKLSERFFVSAVPECWIYIENMILYCHWPMTKDPGKKIRLAVDPKDPESGSWTTHKCRILMNGEKFKTHKETKEAEQIGRNYSSIMDYNNSCDKNNMKRRNQNVNGNKNKIRKTEWIVNDINNEVENNNKDFNDKLTEAKDSTFVIKNGLAETQDSTFLIENRSVEKSYAKINADFVDVIVSDGKSSSQLPSHTDKRVKSRSEDTLNKYKKNKTCKSVNAQWIVNDINNEVDNNTKDRNVHFDGGEQFSSSSENPRDVEYISDEGVELNLHIPTALSCTRLEMQNCHIVKQINADFVDVVVSDGKSSSQLTSHTDKGVKSGTEGTLKKNKKNKIRKPANTQWIVNDINNEVDNYIKDRNVHFAGGEQFSSSSEDARDDEYISDEGAELNLHIPTALSSTRLEMQNCHIVKQINADFVDVVVSDERSSSQLSSHTDKEVKSGTEGTLNKNKKKQIRKPANTQWIVNDINNEVDNYIKDRNVHFAGGEQFSSSSEDTRDVKYISDEGVEFNLHIPTALSSTRLEEQNCLQNKITKILADVNSIEMSVSSFCAEICGKLKPIKLLASSILTATSLASTPITAFNFDDFSKPSQINERVTSVDSAVNLLHPMVSVDPFQIPLDPLPMASQGLALPLNPLPLALVSPALDQSDPASGIKLPILTIDEFTLFEEKIEDVKECEDALINLLTNIQEDTPAEFMKSSIKKLFDHQFFMDKVSWKREQGRVLIKHSKILECLKESYFKKFHIEKDDEFFMKHCRNYKNTHRKSTVNKEKRKNVNCKEN